MYILVFDIGSTNIKTLVLSITGPRDDEKIKLLGKEKYRGIDFCSFFYKVLDKYKIEKNDIETLVLTGTGTSFLDDTIDGINVIKVDEHLAISYGGILLSKYDEAVIVSIGTGTTIVYSNLNDYKRLGGTGLGGGTFVGLSNALINLQSDSRDIKPFEILVEYAKKGNHKNLDLLIGDISKNDILDMSMDITAANFAKLSGNYRLEDTVAATLNLVLENISLLVKALNEDLPVVYIGTLVSDTYVQERLTEIADYTGSDIHFVEDGEFAIAIGAWENYLLKLRKNY